jgi:PDZ domain
VYISNLKGAANRLVIRLFLLLALALGCFTACENNATPYLASITSIGPELIEPGNKIRLRGNGFVEGPAQITLEGAFKPSGLVESTERRIVLEGTAVSDELIEIPVSTRVMKRIVDEPTHFFGNVEVRFTSITQSAIEIVARLDSQELNFRPAGGGVEQAARRLREAEKFLTTLGLKLAGQNKGDAGGIVVGAVSKDSPADLAGILAGDRILAVDGLALAQPTDLAGISSIDAHRFELVSRQGTMREVSLLLTTNTHLDKDEFTAIVLSSIALGLFLAFVAPARRRSSEKRKIVADPLGRAFGFGVISIPLLVFPAIAVLSRSGFKSAIVLIGLNALGLAGLSLPGSGRFATRLGQFLVRMTVLPLAIAIGSVCGSSLGISEIVFSQTAAPWGWHACSSLFVLAMICAAVSILWPVSKMPPGHNQRFVSIATWTAAIPAAALLVIYMFGGWLVPGVPASQLSSSGWLLALGCLIFLAKTWAVLLVARWFSSVDLDERRSANSANKLWLRGTLLFVFAAGATGWVWTELPAAVRSTSQLLATAAFVTFFTAALTSGIRSALGHGVGKSQDKLNQDSAAWPSPAPR